jgi:phosphoglucosamine mutase
VQRDIAEAKAMLAGMGRLLIRESGTEPVVRVMAEGEDATRITHVVDFLCSSLAEAAQLG